MIPTEIYFDHTGLAFFMGFFIYIAFLKFAVRKLKRIMGA